MLRFPLCLSLLLLLSASAGGTERPHITIKVFQFPPNMIPRMDGSTDDWAIVPDSYAIGMDQLENTEAEGGHGKQYDPKNLDVHCVPAAAVDVSDDHQTLRVPGATGGPVNPVATL
jgi:hypothetical protein